VNDASVVWIQHNILLCDRIATPWHGQCGAHSALGCVKTDCEKDTASCCTSCCPAAATILCGWMLVLHSLGFREGTCALSFLGQQYEAAIATDCMAAAMWWQGLPGSAAVAEVSRKGFFEILKTLQVPAGYVCRQLQACLRSLTGF